ncbi:Ribulose-bisphosphate carboxylase [Durusdinium trenchii]|uniref:Ribulose-bisphosphate carboxylase n=1 Tax=Durusdinium trenchii TaxID=1381693 RepID=A0ABP0LMP8_9DINO
MATAQTISNEVVKMEFSSTDEESGEGSIAEVADKARAAFWDRMNAGLLMHYFSKGFMVGSMNAIISGVFAGYLNVPSYLISATLNLATLPEIFTAVMGALSDYKPIFGYHRRPYLVMGWTMVFMSSLIMTIVGLPEPYYCHLEDGTYLYHEEPCNPQAAHEYVPFMWCLFLSSCGLMIAGAAADGLLVQLAKAESEDRRGRNQTKFYMVSALGAFVQCVMTAFGFNGKLYTGSFDQQYQLSFTQCAAIFMVPSSATALSCVWWVREVPAAKRSMRNFWGNSWRLLESRAFIVIAAYLFMGGSIFSISSNAGTWVSLQWAGVKMLQNQLSRLLAIMFTLVGMWLTQQYLLNVSWRKILFFTSVITLSIDAVPQFLTIFNVFRNQYFYLGEPIVTNIPLAIRSLVASFVANEVADENNCALVMGLLTTISNIAGPFAALMSNQIDVLFQPSLTDRQNYIEDQVSFRQTVAASYLLAYVSTILSFATLPLLPWQKKEAQRRKQEWPHRRVYAIIACLVLFIAFLYILTGDILVLDPDLSCLRFLGGTGC